MKPGVITNNFVSASEYRVEISSGSLYVHEWHGGLLIIRRRNVPNLLTFYLHDLDTSPGIALPLDTVTEIPQKPADVSSVPAAVKYWSRLGFRPVFERIRLTRRPDLSADSNGCLHNVCPADPGDLPEILTLLHSSFDQRTGCLPDEATLRGDIESGTVLCVKDQAILGILRVTARTGTVEVRHLAVREDARSRGVARSLVGAFAERYGDNRCVVWMREGLAPAMKTYTAAGFAPDGRRTVVLVK